MTLLLHIACLLLIGVSGLPESPIGSAQLNEEEKSALEFVNKVEKDLLEKGRVYTKHSWNYDSNLTDENEKKLNAYKVCTSISHHPTYVC